MPDPATAPDVVEHEDVHDRPRCPYPLKPDGTCSHHDDNVCQLACPGCRPSTEAPADHGPPAGYLVWWKPDTGEVLATAELDATTRARFQSCSGTVDCQAHADHMLCCPAPSRRSNPE